MSPDKLMADRDFALVAACARPLADAARVAAITRAAAAGFDAERVAALAHRHRIEGFVEQGLAAAGVILPEPAAGTLKAGAYRARLQALRNAGEELRVGQALAAAGIDALFVKGATTALLAHGTLGLKASWDVDVLVSRAQMEKAGEVLTGLGYRLQIFGGIADPVQVRRYLATRKNAEWSNPARETVVELHTELCDHPLALPSVGLQSPRQSVELMPGQSLQTLGPDALLAYLAYHGTAHLWARLKWLVDIGGLLLGMDHAALHRTAVALGGGRTPGVAIALAHELFGLVVQPELLAAIHDDRSTRRLLAYSRSAIAAGQENNGMLMRPFREMVAANRAQGLLMPGLAYRLETMRRFVTQPYVAAHLKYPRWAAPLAIVGLLPVRLLTRARRIRRERAQGAGNTASRP